MPTEKQRVVVGFIWPAVNENVTVSEIRETLDITNQEWHALDAETQLFYREEVGKLQKQKGRW